MPTLASGISEGPLARCDGRLAFRIGTWNHASALVTSRLSRVAQSVSYPMRCGLIADSLARTAASATPRSSITSPADDLVGAERVEIAAPHPRSGGRRSVPVRVHFKMSVPAARSAKCRVAAMDVGGPSRIVRPAPYERPLRGQHPYRACARSAGRGD